MKTHHPALAASLCLLFAFHAAPAQSQERIATVIQQGSANTAAVEQAVSSDSSPAVYTAIINQTGANNHAGGPGGAGGGIIQRNNVGSGPIAQITQNGNGNNAGITQTDNAGVYDVAGTITQTGQFNSAMLRQSRTFDLNTMIDQRGSANIANVEQLLGTGEGLLRASQLGDGNRITVSLTNSHRDGPLVTQTGEGNSATVVAVDAGLGSGKSIIQTGAQNRASIVQTSVDESPVRIVQLGVGNQADTSQTGSGHDIDIKQNGSYNTASVSQSGPLYILEGNRATIAQLGSNNTAVVVQAGQANTATVNQTGTGNFASIYQH